MLVLNSQREYLKEEETMKVKQRKIGEEIRQF